MHGLHALAMLLPPNFWTTFSVEAPVKIIAIAGVLCTIIQLVKVKVPQLAGWWAVALNIILATAGVLSLTQPQNILTVQTLGNVIAAALAAAGIHGSSKLLGSGNTDPVATPPSSNTGMKATAVLCALAMMTMLTGCNDFERTTYQTLSASNAVVNQAQADYEARKIPKTPAAYTIINEAKAAQTLAVQGMETYEEIKNAKNSSADALSKQQAIVTVTLEKLPALILAVKGLYPTQSAPAAPAPMSMLAWHRPIAA